MTRQRYTVQLQAGLGMVSETRVLLKLWTPGMKPRQLFETALQSGEFPGISASSLQNVVSKCFAPRFLKDNDYPAWALKRWEAALSAPVFEQLLFLFTARANTILADFVTEVYWPRYAGGHIFLSNAESRAFVTQACQEGKTASRWSDSTITRMTRYLTGCCADFGLLESGAKTTRKMRPYHIEPNVIAFLAYDLHFSGSGDNAVIAHDDWKLFGLQPHEVRDELKRLALKDFWILQTAGDVTRISWSFNDWEEVFDVIAAS